MTYRTGLFLLWATMAPAAAGTITLDGSYGTSGALSGPNYQITAAMGRQMGNNLFQSFGTFNLSNGESATFSGPANIQNILARVTGGSPSSIDGSINSSIIGANLFLLNPAGVMFGPHAQVNVTGAFAVSTANYLKFSDGGIFYAQLGANDVLSSAPVSAFGFLTTTPQPITFTGTTLTMPEGSGLHVVAGDVTLDGANLNAPGGNLTIFSAASAGEVPFSLASPGTGFASATNTSYGKITMKNSSSAAIDSNSGGGSIVIRGGKVTVDNSIVSSVNSGPVAGGNIAVQANSLALSNVGQIKTDTYSSKSAGSLNIGVSGNLSITGTRSQISADTESSGNGGTVTVNTGGQITLADGGDIIANTNDTGNAGEVVITGGSMSMGGTSRLSSVTTGAFVTTGAGNAGTVSLTLIGNLNMSGSSAIAADTYKEGNGGSITVQAKKIGMTGISLISANTLGSGPGGNILVESDSLSIKSGSYVEPAGITAQSLGGSGKAGTVNVFTGPLNLNAGAVISTSSVSQGEGGSVSVTCSQGVLSNRSSINAFSSNTNAGSVTLTAIESLSLYGTSTLNTSAGGNGGNITLRVGQLLYMLDSSIEAYAGVVSTPGQVVGGNGGNILIDPEFVVLNHSLISANDLSPGGLDGNITNTSNYFFSSNSILHATGTIETTPPDLDLAGSLLVLPGNLVDVQNKLRESCARSINHEFSTLIVVGRGGIEAAPQEFQSDFGLSLRP